MQLKIFSFSILLFSLLINNVFSNELLDIYKEKYLRLKNENESIQISLKIYSKSIKEIDLIRKRIGVLESDYRSYNLNKTEYLARKIRELELLEKSLNQALSFYNKDNNQNRNDISTEEIKNEIKRIKERSTYIKDEIFDLKIKLVEKFGTLPDWAQDENATLQGQTYPSEEGS